MLAWGRVDAQAERRGAGIFHPKACLCACGGGAVDGDGDLRRDHILGDLLRLAVLDAAFPEHRVGVEIDGLAFHISPDRFQGDRRRGNDLTWHGWAVLHFTWDDLTQRPGDVKRRILRELGKQDPTLR